MEIENPRTIQVDGWAMRLRNPPGDGPHSFIVLLHGWTGDENAMWVFASRLPAEALLLAPRGLFSTPLGGFGWHEHRGNGWPHVEVFHPAIEALLGVLTPANFPSADFSHMSLVGFSQGAALAYGLALQYPGRVRSLVGLSGFMPEGVDRLVARRPLVGLPIFIAHGTQDDLVPVEKARQAVHLLQQAGAQVTYCENDVGHKLSAVCFRDMHAFWERS